MSINIKKYTKEQMAQMAEEAAERLESLKCENSTLTEQLKSQTAKTIALRNDLMAKTHSAEELKARNAILTESIEQMNGEAITRENVIANLKADADVLRAQLKNVNDTTEAVGKELQRVNSENDGLRTKLSDTEAALGRANNDLAFKGTVIDVMRDGRYNAEQRADYAEAHPWRNLWTWIKRKLKMA